MEKISENESLYPKATYKRGIFILAAELPDGGHTYISVFKKKSSFQEEGYYQLMFSELLLANSYVYKMREQIEDGKSKTDFPADFVFIQEIIDQQHLDRLQKTLTSDNIKFALINPCLEARTKEHNCPTRPLSIYKYSDFESLRDVFEKSPDSHLNMITGEKDEVANVIFIDNL